MNLLVEMQSVECCTCGVTFAMTDTAMKKYRVTHDLFYCPYCGKSQYFTAKSEVEKLTESLKRYERWLANERARHDQTRADRDHEVRRRAAFQGAVTKTKKRIGKGVCPCCNRYFKNVHRHMSNQHPEYK